MGLETFLHPEITGPEEIKLESLMSGGDSMTKWADVEPIIEGWEELFKAQADFEAKKLKRCRTCVHRKRYALNDYSTKVVQCCEFKPSKKSNSGFKTIKVTDIACYYYEERKKK